jgi:tripartite-type tricarboxylate transporter receptor subunit TctC
MLTLLCESKPISAQTYPQRPVRLVVNVGPGGGVDSIARVIGQHYSALWGQPFVIDNRPGAGGSIGNETVVKAAPDGHTLLVSSGTVVTNAAIRPDSSDPSRDLQPVTRLVSSPYIVGVTPSLPVGSVKDLIALTKSKPKGVTFGSSGGTGSITHLAGELLSLMAGSVMLHVPYKGTGPAYAAVASGEVDWAIGNPVSIMPLIKAGRIKGIAATSAARIPAFPEIPTVAESGIPGYEVVGWYGLFAPAGTPPRIVASLQSEAKNKLYSPEILKRLEYEASDPVANTPQQFTAEVKAELQKWRDVVKRRGIKL